MTPFQTPRRSTAQERDQMRQLFGREFDHTSDAEMEFFRWQLERKRAGFTDRPRMVRPPTWTPPAIPRDITEPRNAA